MIDFIKPVDRTFKSLLPYSEWNFPFLSIGPIHSRVKGCIFHSFKLYENIL